MKHREMVKWFAVITGLPEKTVTETARRLQIAGLIKTGKRGRYGGTPMDEKDSASLVIALLAYGSRRGVAGAVEAVEDFGSRKVSLILPEDLSDHPSLDQPFGLEAGHTFADLVSAAIQNWRPDWRKKRGPFRGFEFSISFPSQKVEVTYHLRKPHQPVVVQYGSSFMREPYALKGVFADTFLLGLHNQLYPAAKSQDQQRHKPENEGSDE